MGQSLLGSYSISVIADLSQFNQAILNATQTLSQQTQLMINMLNAMNVNTSKSMAQMAASINGSSQTTTGVTTAFQSMNTNIANSTNQATRTIAASVQQTTATLNGLQASINNVNTAGIANATGNLTQQHGNLQNALRTSTQSTNMLSGAFGMLRNHLEYMATGVLIAGLISIPAMMIKGATETEILTQKIRQNLELADQYHGNNQMLESDLKRLNDTASTFAVGYGANLKEVNETMVLLSRRFKDVETISYLTSAALTMNKIDFLSLEDGAKKLESVLLQFGLSSRGTRDFVNQLTVAVHTMNIDATNLMDALQRSGSAFKQLNMGTLESIAAISALSNETARTGSTIGNVYKSIATNFDSKKATDALNAYGIALYDVNEQGMKTMRQGTNVFQELQGLFAKLDDEGKRKLAESISGGKFHANSMMAFLADANANFSEALNTLKSKSSDAMTQQLLEMSMETFSVKMQQLKASFQVFSVTIGNQLLPTLKQFAIGLTAGTIWLKEHTSEILKTLNVVGYMVGAYTLIKFASLAYYTAVGLTAIATSALTGTLSLATKGTWAQSAANLAATISAIASTTATYGLAAGFTALWTAVGPVGWAVLAITALGVSIYEIYNNWAPILQWMKDTWNAVVNFISDHIGTIMVLLPQLGAAILLISVTWEPVINFLKGLWNSFVLFMQTVGKIFMSVFDSMCTAFPLFVAAAQSGISNFASVIGDLIRSILPGWGNDVINFFVNLGNKIANITAQIGATIRKNLTITGINNGGGVGDLPYGPQQKEKTPFELAQEQAEIAYRQMLANNTITGGTTIEPTIANQIPSNGSKGKKGSTGDSAYQVAKKEFEAANAKAQYDTESSGKEYTANDKLYLYQAYMSEVTKLDDKHQQETLDYQRGEYDLKRKIVDEKIALQEAELNREIALSKISAEKKMAIEAEIARKKANNIPLTAMESKIDIGFQKVNNDLFGSVKQMSDRTAVINAEIELDKQLTDIANERINRQRQIDQAEIDLDDEKNKILLDNHGINEVQYNLLLIENEAKRYQIKLESLQDELILNKDNQLKVEQIETQITALKASEGKKRLQMQEQLQKAELKNVKELQDNMTSAISKGFQDIFKSSQTLLGAIKSVFTSISDTILKQFSDEWAKKITAKMIPDTPDKSQKDPKIANETAIQAGITAAQKAGSVARNALKQAEVTADTAAGTEKVATTTTTEATTTGIVIAGEAAKTTATQISGKAAVSSSQAALNSMLAMLPLLLLVSALTGGGGNSTTTTDGPGINLGRSPDSYYKTPTALSVPSFDVGTLDVPHDMLAMVHKNEVIVPAPFADSARQFIAGGGFASTDTGSGSGGPTFNLHYNAAHYGRTNKDVQKEMKDNAQHMVKLLHKEWRNFNRPK